MKFTYHKEIRVFLIVCSILSLFGAVTITLEGAYPFDGGYTGVLYYVLSLYFLLHSIIAMLIALRMKKLDARKSTRHLAIFQFSAMPLLFLLLALLSLGVQASYLSWVYYLNIGSLSLIFLFNGFVELYVYRKLLVHNPGYVLVRATNAMAATFSLAFLIIYAATPLKVYTVLEASGYDPQKFIENPFFFILVEILVLFIVVIISLVMLFIGIMCYLTSREGALVDLKYNVKFTRRTLNKYHVGFWFGIVFTTLLFSTSLVSAFSLFTNYISLAALYGGLLLIRIPTFFYERHLYKKYNDNPPLYFNKIHHELIYSSIILILYTAVILFFGVTSPKNVENPPSIYLVLFFLAPFNVIRATMSVIRQHKAKKSGDPHLLTRTCTDIVVALFAVINTFIILGTLVQNNILLKLGMVTSVIMLLSCIGLDVFLIVVGVKGLKNRRPEVLNRFTPYFIKKTQEEDEFELKEKEHAA